MLNAGCWCSGKDEVCLGIYAGCWCSVQGAVCCMLGAKHYLSGNSNQGGFTYRGSGRFNQTHPFLCTLHQTPDIWEELDLARKQHLLAGVCLALAFLRRDSVFKNWCLDKYNMVCAKE